jgi:aspartyl-tRNA synthetase
MEKSMEGWQRTHHLGELSADHDGQNVILMGWVNSRRDHGNLIFVDLRDREGSTQVVLDPTVSQQAHQVGESLRNEFVFAVKGQVRRRPEGMVNTKIKTGSIEVLVHEAKLLNSADPLPFQIQNQIDASEGIRLKYRYLDLRRPELRDKIMTRIQFVRSVRRALEDEGFLDIETPYLYKSTPEGAREFLVPSRVHPGKFYALPQSPQLFKQVLMVAGFDKYYQIAKCFRDEDLRADRQPEFSQVDCEMSFVDKEGLMQTFERVISRVFRELTDGDIPATFPRMSYAEAMENYGNDKPDTRFELKLQNLSDVVAGTEFKVFQSALSQGGIVNAIKVAGRAEQFSRKDLDELTELVKQHGAKGLAWAKVKEGQGVASWQSPIAKFLGDELIDQINQHLSAGANDLILFGAGDYKSTKASLAALRLELGRRLQLIPEHKYNFLWVTDFPLFERDPESGRLFSCHHPFTSPLTEDIPKLTSDPENVRAAAYDLVLNGHEVAGGSIRIHDQKLQSQVFEVLGLTPEDAQQKFGFLLEALRYGAPPHGGIAFGIARLIMILTGAESLRDVIPFPKTNKAACLMTEAPSEVEAEQLRDLHVRVQKLTLDSNE